MKIELLSLYSDTKLSYFNIMFVKTTSHPIRFSVDDMLSIFFRYSKALLGCCIIHTYLIWSVYSRQIESDFDIESLQLPHPLPTFNNNVNLPTQRPLNIAHRGSSGILPEHTLEAYRKAIEQGADVIECDVSITRDLVPICTHESWLNGTTNVADIFPNKLATKTVNGEGEITDYFSVDLTLQELKSLRVKQRFPFRDSFYDGQFEIATLEEYILVAQAADRPIGIYPETKDPEWVNSLDIVKQAGTSFEKIVVDLLHEYHYTKPTDPCFLQSFSKQSLSRMAALTDLPLVMLVGGGDSVTDGDLEAWAEFCYGIGTSKLQIVDVEPDSFRIREVTDLVSRAHARGLKVHPYTFRNEDRYLAWNYHQDSRLEYKLLLSLGADGYFSDFPGTLSAYLDDVYQCGSSSIRPIATLCSVILFVFTSMFLSQ